MLAGVRKLVVKVVLKVLRLQAYASSKARCCEMLRSQAYATSKAGSRANGNASSKLGVGGGY